MASRSHWIQQGECLSTLADMYGFPDGKTIYQDGANAALRKKRPNPLVLAEGDEVVIPDLPPDERHLPTGKEHVIKIKRPKVMLNLRLQKEDGSPIAGKKYTLRVGDDILQGTTTGGGEVTQDIPVQVTEVTLEVLATDDPQGAVWTWDVQVGHLDPVEEVSGLRQRLNNLGFFSGSDLAAAADDALAYALRAFQDEQGLDVTGKPDDATRSKLVDVHGI
jgi:N-acetylmuramoyl-L-alanine amidase